MLM
ncbi:Hemoglobin and hemoglobin-haptoglobin-binding protein A precursor, partial [Haemophilus influenzae]|jgi:DNA-binding NtrC family response regulator